MKAPVVATKNDKIYDDYEDHHHLSNDTDGHADHHHHSPNGGEGESRPANAPEKDETLDVSPLVSVAGCSPGVGCGHMTVAQARIIRGYSCVAFVTGLIGLIVGLAVGLQQRLETPLPSIVAVFNLAVTIPSGPTTPILTALYKAAPFNALRNNVATIVGVSPSAVFLVGVSDGLTGEVISTIARSEAPNTQAARRLGDQSIPSNSWQNHRNLASTISSLTLSMQVEGTVNTVAQASVGLVGSNTATLNAAFSTFLVALSTQLNQTIGGFSMQNSISVLPMSPSATPPPRAVIPTSSAKASSPPTNSAAASSLPTPTYYGNRAFVTGDILLSRVEKPSASNPNAPSRV